MVGNTPDFACDSVRWQNKIDKTGANCAARHSVELRALFTLREGQTAGCFDRTQTGRAVTAGSGKHDADTMRAAFFSERLEKVVNRDIEFLAAADQCELAIFRDHALAGWLHVNRVWFWRRRSCNLSHWHGCRFAEQMGKPAAVMRIEMLHDHKRHARCRRQMAQQFHCRFKSAR